MLAQHSGVIEADFQRVYGIDLNDRWRGTLSLRRIGRLLENLPAGASLYRALNLPQAWTDAEHLAASQFDVLSILAWQQTKDGERNRNRPQPVPRPGDVAEDKHTRQIGGEAESVEDIEVWLRDLTESLTPEGEPSTSTPTRVVGSTQHDN